MNEPPSCHLLVKDQANNSKINEVTETPKATHLIGGGKEERERRAGVKDIERMRHQCNEATYLRMLSKVAG
jgi:hypothetical protein